MCQFAKPPWLSVYMCCYVLPDFAHVLPAGFTHDLQVPPAMPVSCFDADVLKPELGAMQDANVFVSEVDAGVSQDILLGQDRQAYLICIEGGLAVNEVDLSMRDAIEIVATDSSAFEVKLTAGSQGSHFLMIEMQKA